MFYLPVHLLLISSLLVQFFLLSWYLSLRLSGILKLRSVQAIWNRQSIARRSKRRIIRNKRCKTKRKWRHWRRWRTVAGYGTSLYWSRYNNDIENLEEWHSKKLVKKWDFTGIAAVHPAQARSKCLAEVRLPRHVYSHPLFSRFWESGWEVQSSWTLAAG